MKTIFAASALLSLVALASAAPAPNGRGPIGPPHRSSTDAAVIYPMRTSTYNPWNEDVEDGTYTGLVQSNSGNTHPVTTFVTFDIPSETANKKCMFNLRLTNSANVTGTGQAEASAWLDSLNHVGGTWAGHIQAVKGSLASLAPIDCPAGRKYTVELAPSGNEDQIQWDVRTEGPEIVVF